MKNRLLHLFVIISFCFVCAIPSQSVFASSNMIISVGEATTTGGEIFEVPITLSGNTGICGATLTVSYDNGLTLNSIATGSALSNLTLTKPGNLSSNPFVLVWDGMEADSTNGVIATLKFNAPSTAGTYNILVSYDTGDIVDGNLTPISPTIQNGSIVVSGGVVSEDCIEISLVSASPESTVEVPIVLSGKVGICGATLKINYDSNLTLTNIIKGTGLTSLTMTPPGNLSESPVTIVWDGMDEDKSKGTIATLVFTTPKEEGTYNISVSYQNGDIVDGNLNSVALSTVNGSVTVKEAVVPAKAITSTTIKKLTSTYKFNIISEIELVDEMVLVAAYTKDGKLISTNITTFDGDTEGSVSIPKSSNISYAKIFVWNDNLCPLGGAEIIDSGF